MSMHLGKADWLAWVMAAVAGWAAPGIASETYELAGVAGGGIPVQMELTVQPDASVRGHYFIESVKRPRLLEGRLDRRTGKVELTQFDQRCNSVAHLDGVLKDHGFSGSLVAEDQSSGVPIEMERGPNRIGELTGNYACELKKGQFSTRLELAVNAGKLGQFTYLTDFVGGRRDRLWYCAFSSLDPSVEVETGLQHILLRDQQNSRSCRVVISDTGNLVKVQFQECESLCALTAFPHSLLIDKATGVCSEFAAPKGSCRALVEK